MQDEDGEDIPGSETNVSSVIDELPAMSFEDEDGKYHDGINSGRFLIVVTAVGANQGRGHWISMITTTMLTDDREGATRWPRATANVIFPTFLVEGMHGTGQHRRMRIHFHYLHPPLPTQNMEVMTEPMIVPMERGLERRRKRQEEFYR